MALANGGAFEDLAASFVFHASGGVPPVSTSMNVASAARSSGISVFCSAQAVVQGQLGFVSRRECQGDPGCGEEIRI
jgi:hypothetical protein